jgi:hypothetical protein
MPDVVQDQGVPLNGAPSPLDPTLDPALDPSVPATAEMARYTIYVPVNDNSGTEIPHVLEQLRRTLTSAGFDGRTVLRRAQGDWQDYDTEEMDLVMIDAPDTPENLNAIKAAAQGVKLLAGQQSVYLTVQPVKTYLI